MPTPRDIWELSEDGRLRIELHPGQTQAWESKRRYIFVIAGTQSGKTSFVPIWLDREIREQGRGDYLAVTATYDLFKLKFFPEMERYFKGLFRWKYNASDRLFWKQDKPRLFTRIILRSADSKGGLESSSAKAAVLDECGLYKLPAWDAVERRLSLSRGRVLGVTTPYDLGWLYSQIYQPWKRGDKNTEIVQFRSIMNPSFPRAEYYEQKQKKPAWKFSMMYDGQFTRPAGMIYSDFTDFHIIPDYDIPERFPRFLGLDFGGVNTGKIWIAMNPSNETLIAYREKLSGDKTSREHVEEVKDWGESLVRVWGGSKSEKQQRRDFEGLNVEGPPISDVESGIDRVIEALKTKRLYIFKSLTYLIDEFGTYSRKLDENQEPTEEIKNKNNYHLLDALRYVITGILESEIAGGNYSTNYA
jgi:hypothetical protein